MSKKRLHPYKITDEEAKEVFTILSGSGPPIERLKALLKITTGERDRPIGQGFRNDIEQIIKAGERDN